MAPPAVNAHSTIPVVPFTAYTWPPVEATNTTPVAAMEGADAIPPSGRGKMREGEEGGERGPAKGDSPVWLPFCPSWGHGSAPSHRRSNNNHT